MKNENIALTREELHQLVWSKSMLSLAKEYGLSDKGLAKICDKMEIARPPVGYWSKVYSGAEAKIPKLREPSKSCVLKYELKQRQNPLEELMDSLAAQAIKPEVKLSVPEILEKPHKLVRELRMELARVKADSNGILGSDRQECLDVKMSKEQKGRALRIIDVLVKGCEKRGYEVLIEKDRYGRAKTYVVAGGHKFQFSLLERVDRVKYVITPEEKAKLKLQESERRKDATRTKVDYSLLYWRLPEYDRNLTGELQLRIQSLEYTPVKSYWRDRGKIRLEDCLHEFFDSLALGKVYEDKRAAEWKVWHQEQDKLREARKERERLEEERKKRVGILLGEVGDWKLSQEIRSYAQAAGEVRGVRWKEFALGYADEIDPLLRVGVSAAGLD